MDFIRETNFESHEKANCLEGMVSPVDIITQEEIVVGLNITIFIWSTPEIEESHQILVLTVNVAENLDRSINSADHWLGFEHLLSLFSKGQNMFPSESEIGLSIDRC